MASIEQPFVYKFQFRTRREAEQAREELDRLGLYGDITDTKVIFLSKNKIRPDVKVRPVAVYVFDPSLGWDFKNPDAALKQVHANE